MKVEYRSITLYILGNNQRIGIVSDGGIPNGNNCRFLSLNRTFAQSDFMLILMIYMKVLKFSPFVAPQVGTTLLSAVKIIKCYQMNRHKWYGRKCLITLRVSSLPLLRYPKYNRHHHMWIPNSPDGLDNPWPAVSDVKLADDKRFQRWLSFGSAGCHLEPLPAKSLRQTLMVAYPCRSTERN